MVIYTQVVQFNSFLGLRAPEHFKTLRALKILALVRLSQGEHLSTEGGTKLKFKFPRLKFKIAFSFYLRIDFGRLTVIIRRPRTAAKKSRNK